MKIKNINIYLSKRELGPIYSYNMFGIIILSRPEIN